MAGMARMVEWHKEWQNGRMAENGYITIHTYFSSSRLTRLARHILCLSAFCARCNALGSACKFMISTKCCFVHNIDDLIGKKKKWRNGGMMDGMAEQQN